jgi:tetratricopeptide (TPR) repeat protein
MNNIRFLVMLLFTAGVQAQNNCHCPLLPALQYQQRNDPSFSLSAAAASLKKSSAAACMAGYNELYAQLLISRAMFDSAGIYLQKALDYYTGNNCSNSAFITYYKTAAQLFHNKGDYAKATELCFKLLPLTEAQGYQQDKAYGLLLIAASFNRTKESAKGIVYAREAIPVISQLELPLEKASLLHDLSVRYLWRYQDTKNETLLDSAELFLKNCLQIARTNQYSRLLAKAYNKMNGLAYERRDYKAAMIYIDSSLQIFKNLGDTILMATSYGDKADVMMELEQYTEAKKFADTCLQLHQQTKNPETIANAWALIYEISNRSQNYKDAVWAMNNYIEITDSLTNAKKSEQINELEQKYNKAKNEKTIKELAQQKQIYLLLALAAMLAAAAIAFFLRQQKLRHKKHILETEQRLNRARMNPHFFFNALTALQKFALKENNGQVMASNLSKFSNIMRETLESTYKEYVTIEQEMEFLNEYLEVQKIRFPQAFSYDVSAAADLEVDALLIPAMIIQPFVENSIEHGFAGVEYAGKITVRFEQENKNLLICITDNGKGLLTTVKENNEHISRASQIIKDRIYLLNIKLKTKAGFSIDNGTSGHGVAVKINLPLLYKS